MSKRQAPSSTGSGQPASKRVETAPSSGGTAHTSDFSRSSSYADSPAGSNHSSPGQNPPYQSGSSDPNYVSPLAAAPGHEATPDRYGYNQNYNPWPNVNHPHHASPYVQPPGIIRSGLTTEDAEIFDPRNMDSPGGSKRSTSNTSSPVPVSDYHEPRSRFTTPDAPTRPARGRTDTPSSGEYPYYDRQRDPESQYYRGESIIGRRRRNPNASHSRDRT